MKKDLIDYIPDKYKPAIDDIFRDEDGIWIYLKQGYYADGMGCYNECQIIHEDTIKELLYQVRLIKEV